MKNILLFTGGFVMYRKRHQHWMYPFKVVMTLYNVNTVPETVMKENTVKYTSGVCLEHSFFTTKQSVSILFIFLGPDRTR